MIGLLELDELFYNQNQYTAEPIILNINTKISEYLNKVVGKSNDKISTEFNFSRFDSVNIYLIRQSLNKQKHLWVNPCDDNIIKFYQSVIFAVAVDFFKKNYCENKKIPHKIGDKYQQSNNRYEVIDVDFEYEGMKNLIKLKCTGKGKSSIHFVPSANLTDKFRKLNNPHKFAIVAQKNHFESCFSQLDKKAFPYTYIADSGEETKNLPVSEPMFFVASNYSTIQKYIFDENISLDTIIFMGEKYDYQLQQDIYKGRFKQGIFIGKKEPDVHQLLQWHWTLPEYQYFDGLEQGQIKTVKVNNAILEERTAQFIQYIEQLERYNYINLKQLPLYVSYIYPLVVLSDNSPLKNGIDILSKSFQKKSKEVLGEAFSSIDADDQEANE